MRKNRPYGSEGEVVTSHPDPYCRCRLTESCLTLSRKDPGHPDRPVVTRVPGNQKNELNSPSPYPSPLPGDGPGSSRKAPLSHTC
jgi:hypothetical protein